MDCVRAGRGGLKRHLFKCNIASNVSSLSSRLLQIRTYFGVCSFRDRKFIQECVELFARFAFTQNNFGVVLFFWKSWHSKFIQECVELFAGFAFFTKQFSGRIFLLGVDVQEHKHEASSKKQLSSFLCKHATFTFYCWDLPAPRNNYNYISSSVELW